MVSKKHDQHDCLVRLENTVREAFIHKQHCLAVFFDLEKAYDTTWRFGILRDLAELGIRGGMLDCRRTSWEAFISCTPRLNSLDRLRTGDWGAWGVHFRHNTISLKNELQIKNVSKIYYVFSICWRSLNSFYILLCIDMRTKNTVDYKQTSNMGGEKRFPVFTTQNSGYSFAPQTMLIDRPHPTSEWNRLTCKQWSQISRHNIW